jgi:hypothetical protein
METFDLEEGRRSAAELSAGMDRGDSREGAECANLEGTAKASAMHVEHLDFLKRVSSGDEPAITPETASRAAIAWRQIWSASGGKIPVPSACTNADGKVFYSWDSDRYHLDLDIIPGEPAGFFFCDRQTHKYFYEDYQIGSPLPEVVVAKLNHFA